MCRLKKNYFFLKAAIIIFINSIFAPFLFSFSLNENKTLISPKHSLFYYIPVSSDNDGLTGEMAPRLRNKITVKHKDKNISVQTNFLIDIIPDYESETGSTSSTSATDDEELRKDRSTVVDAIPLETSIKWSPGKFIFEAGYKYYTWGTADGINPTDNINPRDYTTVDLDDDLRKLPVLGLSAEFFPIEQISIMGIYLPHYQKPVYPDSNIPAPSSTDPLYQLKLIQNPDYSIDEPEKTSRKLSSGGGKINFFLPVIDFSFSYLYSYEQFYTPIITTSGDVDVTPEASFTTGVPGIYNLQSLTEVKVHHKRMHYIGTDFKITIDELSLWGEGCYSFYKSTQYPEINDRKVSWTTGIEYDLPRDYKINLQYSGRYIFNYDNTFTEDYKLTNLSFYNNSKEFYEEYFYRMILPLVSNEQEALRQLVALTIYPPQLADDLVQLDLTVAYSFVSQYDKGRYPDKRLGGLRVVPKLIINISDNQSLTLGAYINYAYKKRKEDGKIISDDDDFMIGRWRPKNYMFIDYSYIW